MATLSSAGWIVHDVGLATAIGGSLFGKVALEPALEEISAPFERDHASEKAWNRFSWINLAGHVAFALPWLLGRKMLTGREVSARARGLTRTKDVLVVVSLITGISSIILGKVLGRKVRKGEGPAQAHAGQAGQAPQGSLVEAAAANSRSLARVVGTLGTVNMIANASILAMTTLLAMESSRSIRFPAWSRRLP
jgi:hypothetical protein